ncbi:hypothetical protein Patl1_03230 [Pistacia atlantica]|uniref:Uncharacterized protein n=1 Tax=Pistacia atlantica TaxID=434234 RepID=A0ACC1CCT5_9ROSI|nr:hypothetical protein Patl1_03230 [Pistacia atlantica]
MVYITSWDEFVERSVQLYRADPQSTRYCMKYRHCDGKLVLKLGGIWVGFCCIAKRPKKFVFVLCFLRAMNIMFTSEKGKPRTKKLALVITVKVIFTLGKVDRVLGGPLIDLSKAKPCACIHICMPEATDLHVFECLKFKTDQAQDAKKMEKLNNIFFALMARGPDVNISEITGKEQMEAQPGKKGRGRKQ